MIFRIASFRGRRYRKDVRRTFALIAFCAVTAMFAASAHATDLATLLNNRRPTESFRLLRVADLAALIHDPAAHVRIYDANHNELRRKAGMIPGARPLSSDDHYNVGDELPTNKNAKLVFYCADLH
jgi:hypothetical protein